MTNRRAENRDHSGRATEAAIVDEIVLNHLNRLMDQKKLAEFSTRFRRRAIIMEVGGFKPSLEPTASWFGRVQCGLPGEEWPMFENRPLQPLAQLNLRELPFKPGGLGDIDFITIFMDGQENLPFNDEPNGVGWCLRAYKDLSLLVPMLVPKFEASTIRPVAMRPTICEADYPARDDVPEPFVNDLDHDYEERFPNSSGFKLGGWPTLIQSEIFWAPWNKHPISPEYAFQIDSNDEANWAWGDAGIGYFGRGTAEGRTDEWALSWQCC